MAHGVWNGIVAVGFVAAIGSHPTCGASPCEPSSDPAGLFNGPGTLLGEFGWIAAVTMLALGAVTAVWHVRHPVKVTGNSARRMANVTGYAAPPLGP